MKTIHNTIHLNQENTTAQENRPIELMGIVNITPDSFSDGGQFLNPDKALVHIERLIKEGATLIDIGAESTRPGAEPVSISEECDRLMPILKQFGRHFSVPLSLDTVKPEVMALGLQYNVSIINSVQPVHDRPKVMDVLKNQAVDVVLMHMIGTPQTMQNQPEYDDVVDDIDMFFEQGIRQLSSHIQGRVILDPGVGFGKTLAHNVKIMNQLARFKQHHCPLMIGVSNKSFLGAISGQPVQDRLVETITAQLWAIDQGVNIVRCHNPGAMKAALATHFAIRRAI